MVGELSGFANYQFLEFHSPVRIFTCSIIHIFCISYEREGGIIIESSANPFSDQ